jgi:type IV secretion system protein VirB11
VAEKLRRELEGPVLRLMDDPRTEDILRNPDRSLWAYVHGDGFVRIGEMSDEQAMSAVGTVASCRQTVIDHLHPILETELPLNGARFEAIVPPVTTAPVFVIRLRPRRIHTLADYQSAGILTCKDDVLNKSVTSKAGFIQSARGLDHIQILKKAVAERLNIVCVGRCAAGKTTLTNAVLDTIAQMTPDDRVITIEDTLELQCSAANVVDLHAVGNTSMDDCVRASLRLRPTRIVVGEVRGAECLQLLKSWQTGHPGGVATVHGSSVIDGLVYVESLVAEAADSAAGRNDSQWPSSAGSDFWVRDGGFEPARFNRPRRPGTGLFDGQSR